MKNEYLIALTVYAAAFTVAFGAYKGLEAGVEFLHSCRAEVQEIKSFELEMECIEKQRRMAGVTGYLTPEINKICLGHLSN